MCNCVAVGTYHNCLAAKQHRPHIGLAIRLLFHNRPPEQLTTLLAFHQQAADELGDNDFGGAT